MSKLKVFLISVYLFIPLILFAQKKSENVFLKKALQKKVIEFKEDVNFNKAQYFYINKKWDSTLVYCMKQLNLSKNKQLTPYCHYLRGSSFFNLKLFNEAEKELLLTPKNFAFYALVNDKLGQVAAELSQFEKAIHYFNEVEKTPKIDEQGVNLRALYINLGVCHLHIKKFEIAEKYLLKSKKILEKENNINLLTNFYTNIANLYYEQYKDNEAIPYFEKAYQLSLKSTSFDLKRNASQNMSVVEENRNNLKKALVYRKEIEQWKDSIYNQNKIWAVADCEKKYAVAQKQKQIKVLEVENKLKETQRNTLFYSAIAMLLLLTAGVYFYAKNVRNARIILFQKNKLDELNVAKDQLFSIVSHDLRSSVNALKTSNTKLTATLESKNYNELDQLLQSNSAIANGAYSLLDNLLHWAMLQTKQLYFHKESVHLLSIVQQVTFNYQPLLNDKNISFENTVAKNKFVFVDLDSIKIVLRNLLDNAIKFSNVNDKISIYTIETTTNFCQLIIEDTGFGMTQNTIDELLSDNELLAKKNNSEIIGTGLGMQLCKQMITKNGGSFAIESEINKGTKIIIWLPKTEQNG